MGIVLAGEFLSEERRRRGGEADKLSWGVESERGVEA